MKKEEILSLLNARNHATLMETFSIEYVDVGDDFLTAKMPVNATVHQPDGVLHGGAMVALAESVGSAAAALRINPQEMMVRGIEIAANHVRSVRSGYVWATAKALHAGKTTQLWDIKITNEDHQLISSCKLTTLSLPRKS